jgi:hypothetical protein
MITMCFVGMNVEMTVDYFQILNRHGVTEENREIP